jgi:phosphoribosylpyrophosphate synthetase
MLFFQDQYQYLAAHFSKKNYYELKKFANQEFIIKISDSIAGQNCVVIGSLTAPQEQVVSLLLLLHMLVQEKAACVVLYSPYLGYQRQDVQKIGRSCGLLWADTILHATGIQKIITIEPHCEKVFSHLQ